MWQSEQSVFLRISDGVEGHHQLLALFDQTVLPYAAEGRVERKPDAETSTLHHLALTISRGDYAAEKRRLADLGLEVRTAEHESAQWRSLYVDDPEGNVVELVCYDPSL